MKKLLVLLLAAALCFGACKQQETIPGLFVPTSQEVQQDTPEEAFSHADIEKKQDETVPEMDSKPEPSAPVSNSEKEPQETVPDTPIVNTEPDTVPNVSVPTLPQKPAPEAPMTDSQHELQEALDSEKYDKDDFYDWGIRLDTENVTSTGLTLLCTQSGGEFEGELHTGSPFSLSVYKDDQWQPVEETPSEYERTWTMEAWMIPKNDVVRWDVNWEFLYGELEPGLYRITKSITNWRAPGDYDEQSFSVGFTIGALTENNPLTAKPVIYLYPEEETEVSVTLDYNGQLTCTYPLYNNGWTVTAQRDGTLIDADGRSYYCLYWEGVTEVEYDFSEGFVVKGEDTAAFLEKALAQLGLNEREANEFIIYWLPLMEENSYNLIAFQDKCYTENAQLSIEPTPDSLIRVFMAWKPLEEFIELPTQTLHSPDRSGFTAVEWGGTKIQ